VSQAESDNELQQWTDSLTDEQLTLYIHILKNWDEFSQKYSVN